ncbi:hypothetical protein [Sphaerimonospora thailandensis]|uniref:Uncharacterized protein n=1 Tax=Sphaerimonospora thailandensis TaxID=795644 RepID=A0A8J3VYW3_9ACTN|nr:hypothetical protein [Sphaerimonospora thailandensis]GIH69408.1 hypothetical protein Mth01_16610 [Sphaerimonospora thailandensis]
MQTITRDEAAALLKDWASTVARRDILVRAAYGAGVGKSRIHAITGIARTTIDRILVKEQAAIVLDIVVTLHPADDGEEISARDALQQWIDYAEMEDLTVEIVSYDGPDPDNDVGIVEVGGARYAIRLCEDEVSAVPIEQ